MGRLHVRPRLAPGQWHGFLRPAAKPPVVGGDLGRGRRTSPSSAAPLSPKPADGPRTAAFGLVGFSVFVVRLFSSPSVCPSWGKGPPSTPPPKPWSGPAVSDRPARQPRSRGATKTPAAPTAQGVQPRPPASTCSPASSSCRLWLKVCSCRSLVSPLVRRNLEMKDTAAAISPIMVAARV